MRTNLEVLNSLDLIVTTSIMQRADKSVSVSERDGEIETERESEATCQSHSLLLALQLGHLVKPVWSVDHLEAAA